MAGPTDSTPGLGAAQPGIERAKMIVNEIASAAQSAALSLVDEQKTRAADQVNSFAQALHAAGQSFENSDRPVAAEYTHSAARQIEAVVDSIRGRHWTEIAADLEETARHRPIRFMVGAVLVGFIVGRLLTTASRHPQPSRTDTAAAAEGNVRAAVASASGNGEMADWRPSGQTQGLP
jgi:hypothetical protein